MQIEKIQALAELMAEQGLGLLELEENGDRLVLQKGFPAAQAAVAASPVPAQAEAAPQSTTPEAVPQGDTLDAPLVGCVYLAPSPDAEPFVKPGASVKKGQVLCIIEAMKVMNDFTAPKDGVIAEILVQNGQLVEYGQPMFRMG